ncbi:MAG: hypothetical protein L3J19_02560 [Sulfurimonas sp.]|nr:hypothetical protein [Sulfurimonas sp.]
MSEGFDKLKDIGAQKIHEATHISRAHVQAFLHESFDDMNKIQFLGFISILEREYGVNLDEVKSKGLEYFDEKTLETQEDRAVDVFVPSKKKRNLALLYMTIAIVIFFAFSYLNIFSTNYEISDVVTIDNSAIESAKNNLLIAVAEIKTDDINGSGIKKIELKEVNLDNSSGSQQVEEVKKESDEIVSFKIIPTNEVWLGYIDLATYEKGQKLFMDEFSLDPNKDWLLTFGHGYISIEVNGIIKKFKNPKNVRFSYINGELKEINIEEFKVLNKGSRW